jgi:hypothetical protein
MKALKLSLPLILIALALLLSGGRSAYAGSKNPRTNQHQRETTRNPKPISNQAPQIPLAMWQQAQAALNESIASAKEQAEAAKAQAEAYKETWCSPSVLVQAVLTVITGLFLVFAELQWKLSERALKANVRPRVSIGILPCVWGRSDDGLILSVTIPYQVKIRDHLQLSSRFTMKWLT